MISQLIQVRQSAAPPLVGVARVLPLPLQSLIPSASLEEHRGRELRFLLPLHQARPAVLTLLFQQLEAVSNEMGVTSYGLTACSMEEIFVRLTQQNEPRHRKGAVGHCNPVLVYSNADI